MVKVLLLLSLFVLYVNGQSSGVEFGKTNIVWTIFNGKRTVAAFLPGNPFTGPRRYGTIPWIYSGKIPYGISYHYEKNLLIMSDLSRNNIYTINTGTGFWNSTEFLTGFGWVEHTAVDWISDNVYWVDAYYEWIAMKPIDSDDPADYKVIADSSVISPRGIAVDPNRGYMFWTDVSKPGRIVRAMMDGTKQLVLVTKATINPFDITINPENGQLFWVDRERDTMETVMNNGSSRRVIFTSHQGQPVGLSYYRDHLFFADTTFDDVVILDLVNGLGKNFFKLNQRILGRARVLTVWAKENQPDQNGWKGKCQAKNCGHYCVLDTSGNPKCLCQENFELQPDGTSCKEVSKVSHHALIFTNGSHICSYDITVLQLRHEPEHECYPEGQNEQDIKSLAVDSNGKAVFYSSKARQEIRRLNLEDGTSRSFSSDVLEVGGMSFDYVEKVLYWSDVKNNEVKKQATTGGVASSVFFETNLGDIAVDPYHRLLFYIKKDDKSPQILKHDLDVSNGKNTVLTGTHPIIPQRLTYDDKNQRLFWTDKGKIQSVSFDGKVSPSVGTLNVNNRAIAYYGKFLLWSTAQKNGTSLLHMYKPPDKSTYKRLRLYFPSIITDYGIFDRMRHTTDRDACFVRNGGCSQICIPSTTGDKCACKLGYNLNNDKTSCRSNLVADNYTFASDTMSKRVLQIDLKTGSIAGTLIGEGTLVSNVVVIKNNAYWADQTARVIVRSNVDGTEKRSIYSTGLLSVQRIAVDPSTENIFFTASDGNVGKIGVIRSDGSRMKTLISDAKFPRDIKLHSKYGLMFWVERSGILGIERATMAGGNRLLIHRPAANSQIYGIEIDYETDMIYWCDKKDGYIRRADFFGASLEEVIQDKETSMTDLAILGKHLYYTGTNRNGILRINKKDATGAILLTKSPLISQLHDLSIVSKSMKIPQNAKCAKNNAGCSSLCLSNNDTFTFVCACSDQDTLTSNLLQCAGDLHPSYTAFTKPPSGQSPVTPPPRTPYPTLKPTSASASPSVTQASKQDNNVSMQDDSVNPAAIAVPIVVIVIIAAVLIVGFIFYRRRQSKRSPLVSDPRGSENPGYFNGTTSNVETVTRA